MIWAALVGVLITAAITAAVGIQQHRLERRVTELETETDEMTTNEGSTLPELVESLRQAADNLAKIGESPKPPDAAAWAKFLGKTDDLRKATWTPATVNFGWKAEADIPRYAIDGDLVHVAGTFSNLCTFDRFCTPSIIGLPRPAMNGTVMFRTLVGNGVMTGLLGADGTITVLTSGRVPMFAAFQIADLAYLKASQ